LTTCSQENRYRLEEIGIAGLNELIKVFCCNIFFK
jgi:hypothetical protein